MSSPASASTSVSAQRYRDGVRAALAVAATVSFFGASFGLVARSAGMGMVAPVVMSATTFAGSAQFAVSSILGAAGGATSAIAAAVLLNARYAPISISVAGLFRGPRLRRLLESQLIVDESWALAARGGRFDRRILLGAGLLLYVSWVIGTAVGALAGDALGDPKDFGLDGAFPSALPGPARAAAPHLASGRGRAVRSRHRFRADPGDAAGDADRRGKRRVSGRPEVATVSTVWLVVLVVGLATVALKATGPVLLGGRELPRAVASVVGLLAPVLLAALVVTQTVGGDNELVLDARLAGVSAGAAAIAARAPLPAVVVVAAVATAVARLIA